MRCLRNKIWVLVASIFLLGCTHYIKDAEELSGLNLKGKVKFEKKKEYWDNWQGNGFRALVYNITDINYFNSHKNDKGAQEFDFSDKNNPFANSIITEFINNGKGYYYSLDSKQKETALVVDLKNRKMVYYYIFM